MFIYLPVARKGEESAAAASVDCMPRHAVPRLPVCMVCMVLVLRVRWSQQEISPGVPPDVIACSVLQLVRLVRRSIYILNKSLLPAAPSLFCRHPMSAALSAD